MNTDYVEEMVKEIRNALDMMSYGVRTHLPQLGEEMMATVDSLDSRLESIRNQRKRDILNGNGPIAQLRADLGYAKPKTQVDIFERWKPDDRLTEYRLNMLMAEFFGSSMVQGTEGGDYYPSPEGLEEISQDPNQLTTGLFRINDGWVAMILTFLDGTMLHHLIYPLKTSLYNRQKLEATVVSYAEAERTWVTHRFFELLNTARVRTGLVTWLESQGVEIPTPVPMEEVERGVLERIKVEEGADVSVLKPDVGKRKIEVTVDNYRATAIYSTLGEEKEPHVVVMVKLFHGPNMWQSDKSLEWDDLTPTKQLQLFRKLTQVEKPDIEKEKD